jgi:uncharacterized membrane protein
MSHDVRVSSRLVWMLMILFASALLATSVYRAATSAFTHDESLSFASFNWAPQWSSTPNNHFLNTWLMRLCSSLFGNSELSLRAPNIAAHAIYLAFTLLLLKRIHHVGLQVVGFILLNLNPFLLDFFSLARGYGLALGFLMLSLYLLVRGYEERQRRRRAVNCWLSGLAAAAAVLANFAFLTWYVPMVVATAWVLSSDRSFRRISDDRLKAVTEHVRKWLFPTKPKPR